jgi:hypothetical protein
MEDSFGIDVGAGDKFLVSFGSYTLLLIVAELGRRKNVVCN